MVHVEEIYVPGKVRDGPDFLRNISVVRRNLDEVQRPARFLVDVAKDVAGEDAVVISVEVDRESFARRVCAPRLLQSPQAGQPLAQGERVRVSIYDSEHHALNFVLDLEGIIYETLQTSAYLELCCQRVRPTRGIQHVPACTAAGLSVPTGGALR